MITPQQLQEIKARCEADLKHLERCEALAIDHCLSGPQLDRIDLMRDLDRLNALVEKADELMPCLRSSFRIEEWQKAKVGEG